jgi:hypothetical protein
MVHTLARVCRGQCICNPAIWLKCVVAASLQSMGWLNAIVYCRPRGYLAFRRAQPEVNLI